MQSPSSSEEAPEDTDPFREARAYNYSIYMMVGMPYLLLGTVGLLIWRAVKQKARADQLAAGPPEADTEAHNSCPENSREDVS